jgi:hypothetical protein
MWCYHNATRKSAHCCVVYGQRMRTVVLRQDAAVIPSVAESTKRIFRTNKR